MHAHTLGHPDQVHFLVEHSVPTIDQIIVVVKLVLTFTASQVVQDLFVF